MVVRDHGFFRLVYLNLDEVAPGFWRSAQPAPHHLRRVARRHGIRTVVNLRGVNPYGSYALERETCRELGLELVDFPARSRSAPPRAFIREAAALFQRIRYPALFHCKSGADRTGIVAALYLLVHLRRPPAEALRQLSLRYGHVRQARTGVLDFTIATYAAEAPGGEPDFATWAETRYDPEAVERRFRERGWASVLVDTVLRRE